MGRLGHPVFIVIFLALQLSSAAIVLEAGGARFGTGSGSNASQPLPAFNHCSTSGTTVIQLTQTQLASDLVIGQGQSYIISGRTLDMRNFNFIVNGGILIVNNSVLKGFTSEWQVERGGCAEITDSFDYVSADSINVGGNPPPMQSSPDGSSLFVNHSTMLPGIQITGRDVVVKIVDSIFQDNIFFNGWVTNWPVEQGETEAEITNTVVPTIALAFGGPNQGADISNLAPGHLPYWNLHQNLTVYNVPYDLTLRNVTLIPNSGGEGNLLGGGWGLQFTPGGSYGMYWPHVTVTNSEIGELAFYWFGARIASGVFSNLGLSSPTTQTIFGTVNFVNSTIEGFIDIGCDSCNLTLDNVRGLGIFVGGKTNITMQSSWTDDSFQPNGCTCRVTFNGNSSLGRPSLIPFTTLPFYRDLPNASWWQSLGGVSFVTNSHLLISGNYTDRLVGPGFPGPGTNLFWTNSTASRVYPVVVYDQSHTIAAGAEVSLATSTGSARHYTTDSAGRVNLRLYFTDGNRTNLLPMSAVSGQQSGATQIGFASATPFLIEMSFQAATTTTSSSSGTSTSSSTTTATTTTSSAPHTSTSLTTKATGTSYISTSSTSSATVITTTQISDRLDLAPFLVAALATGVGLGLVVLRFNRGKKRSKAPSPRPPPPRDRSCSGALPLSRANSLP